MRISLKGCPGATGKPSSTLATLPSLSYVTICFLYPFHHSRTPLDTSPHPPVHVHQYTYHSSSFCITNPLFTAKSCIGIIKLLLHLRGWNEIDNVLGSDILFLHNSLEVQLDCLCKVFIFEDWRFWLAKVMEWEFPTTQNWWIHVWMLHAWFIPCPCDFDTMKDASHHV